MTQQLLMIEDDTRLANMVSEYLRQAGYGVTHAADGASGLVALDAAMPDLIILDLMLPDMDGLEVCRRVKAQAGASGGPGPAILMLTAKGDPMDRIVGLEIGADDYLPKPFEPRELVARLQTVLRRRRAGNADSRLAFDDLTIDAGTRSVRRQGLPVELTGTEFDLLTLLARAPGKVFGRDDIAGAVLMLCREEARWVTGNVIEAAGGISL